MAGYEMNEKKKKQLKVENSIIFLMFCIQQLHSPTDFIPKGYWASFVFLRVNKHNELITNDLTPEFTAGLVGANPSNGCLRCSGLE